jgi:16S rRNA (uracil1498-N3)-methyltransferase
MNKAAWFYFPNPKSGVLPEEESLHAVKVLRKRVGDEIEGFDGKGNKYQLRISQIQGKDCKVEVEDSKSHPHPYKIHLTIAIAPPKSMDRIKTMVEKLTEIGVDQIQFLNCDHSERVKINMPRIQRVRMAAAKQCGALFFPEIKHIQHFHHWAEQCQEEEKFICHLPKKEIPRHLIKAIKGKSTMAIAVGPEGDFSADEISFAMRFGFAPTSLGPQVLRTETAAVVACTTARTFAFIEK